ncbi:ATP-binding protein [Roseateles sp.]|uniref:ATP-binding protein n=1 Tax=Roseateles sp. TaxID=1971397 RepID=UPI0039E8B091
MRSIERALLAWISGAFALGTALVAGVAYAFILEEMSEVFDEDLRNVATSLAHYQQVNGLGRQAPFGGEVPLQAPGSEETEIATFAWDSGGRLLYSSNRQVHMPLIGQEGLTRLKVGDEQWVVYTVRHRAGASQAAQRISSRREMARESATHILPPLLLLAAGIGVLLIFGLRRGLRPLDEAARDVASRSAASLRPIEGTPLPRELAPMVHAINGLMARLDDSMTAQRRFLADAAHELRSPVTALRLQLQLLDRSPDDVHKQAAMAELQQGIDRAQRLIEQLLHFARTEPEAQLSALVPLDLGVMVREVVEALNAKAESWQIDLGAELHGPVPVMGDADQLVVLLNNLVENALRYTPAGGVVDVGAALQDGRPVLFVRDTGPGIAAAERERVFDRFYRGEQPVPSERAQDGSGLGLSIVKAIAQRHSAAVRLLDREGGPGLEVRVVFPPFVEQRST